MEGRLSRRKRGRADEQYSESNKRWKQLDEREGKERVIDYSDPFAVSRMIEEIGSGKYGSVTKEVEELIARKRELINSAYQLLPEAAHTFEMSSVCQDIVVADDMNVDSENNNSISVVPPTVVIIDSDEDDEKEEKPSNLFDNPAHAAFIQKQADELLNDSVPRPSTSVVVPADNHTREKKSPKVEEGLVDQKVKDKGVYLGVEDELNGKSNQGTNEDEGLSDIWQEMSVALECSKDVRADQSSEDDLEEKDEDCAHSFILKDDIGYVCRVCGIIEKSIEHIIEYQHPKAARRSYRYESRTSKNNESTGVRPDWMKLSDQDLSGFEQISAHPRHMEKMKPHQVEGFKFLQSNLLSADNSGGCILAHAPGSGKTFMIISFMQSFLAKCPNGKPLVILPKGILPTWKKEFQRWQVENIPLLDLYSVKAEGRSQQLGVLKEWKEQRSILFLGYTQFTKIVTDDNKSEATVYCRELLLKEPNIVILDEGHTPRNDDTEMLTALKRIVTPNKVVLSGTLYQNHVKEVFSILKLVRPLFFKQEISRAIKKRILSIVQISGVRKQLKGKGDAAFYDLVENALQEDNDSKIKENVIKDLRELTSGVLHYYKGDFLDELPGLLDFTVLLKMGPKQRCLVEKLMKYENSKFRRSNAANLVYVHPNLKSYADGYADGKDVKCDDANVDGLLEKLDIREGVKAKFFLSMLGLCEAAGEKLLVFSQLLLPLKFLERLAVQRKGWSVGKEIFAITGDTKDGLREDAMDRFNNSSDARVLFGSIKACGEGISLVGASRVIILDVHLNPSVSRQALGRAFRPGQTRKVYTYRLVAADSPEEQDHRTCLKKELIAKRWFEWNEYCGSKSFDMDPVDPKLCGDDFLESSQLAEDVEKLLKR